MFEIGKSVFIRKVTMIFTGKVVGVSDGFVQLSDAAWIADTGRYSQAVATGDFMEVEPYPDNTIVNVSTGDIVDWVEVKWPLPRLQK